MRSNDWIKYAITVAAVGCSFAASPLLADSFRRLPQTIARIDDGDDACNALVGEAVLASGRRAYRWTVEEGLKNVCPLGNKSSATKISDDGSTVAGTFQQGGDSLFLWRASTGAIDGGTLGGKWVVVGDLSADGDVVVGYGSIAPETTTNHAFRATFDQARNKNLQDLGTLGGEDSFAYFVSADGGVVVGASQIPSGDWHVFRWTQAEGMVDLGAFEKRGFFIGDISDDGSVIVGTWQNARRAYVPFVSVDGSQIATIPGLEDSAGNGIFVSDDGRVVTGDARVRGVAGGGLPYRYPVGGSSYISLGTYIEGGSAGVEAVSGDGKVVTGWAEGTPDNSGYLRVQGFYHGELTSVRRILDKVFENQLLDTVDLRGIRFLSDDGRRMVLSANVPGEGFIWIHVQLDDYPRVIDENYFATRPGANEIAYYVSESASAATSLAEANPGDASAEYAAVYADYAQQYQDLAAAIVVDGVDDQSSIGLYAEYRYQALLMSYNAYANASAVYYSTGGLAPFSAEATANAQYAYDCQLADLEDLFADE